MNLAWLFAGGLAVRGSNWPGMTAYAPDLSGAWEKVRRE
jgi:hypothetical protein